MNIYRGVMAFRTIEGFAGSVYTPDIMPNSLKKHNCEDCTVCQMCSDERCELCLKGACRGPGCESGKIIGQK